MTRFRLSAPAPAALLPIPLSRALAIAIAIAIAIAFAPALPALAAGFPIEGTWALDAKASENVPESKKGVDLRIERKGNQITTTRLVGGKPVGEPLVVVTDGTARPFEASGQKGTVSAFWSGGDKALEQELKVGVEEQHAVITLSAEGGTMTRVESILKAGVKTSERKLVYRRK